MLKTIPWHLKQGRPSLSHFILPPSLLSGNNRLPGIMALGYIAAFSETLSLSVIAEKALPPLVQVRGGWKVGRYSSPLTRIRRRVHVHPWSLSPFPHSSTNATAPGYQ